MNLRFLYLIICIALVSSTVYQIFMVSDITNAIVFGITGGASMYLVVFKLLPYVMGDKE